MVWNLTIFWANLIQPQIFYFVKNKFRFLVSLLMPYHAELANLPKYGVNHAIGSSQFLLVQKLYLKRSASLVLVCLCSEYNRQSSAEFKRSPPSKRRVQSLYL